MHVSRRTEAGVEVEVKAWWFKHISMMEFLLRHFAWT